MILVKDREKLIEKITKAGFSYRQLAKEIGCSQTQVSLITKGERNPSPEIAVSICEAIKASFDTIFFIKSNDKSNRKINLDK